MAEVRMTLEEYEAIRRLITSERESEGARLALRTNDNPEKATAKPRRRSKYNKELSKQLKRLGIKHPRTKQSDLMAKAHTATRKSLKMPARRKRK